MSSSVEQITRDRQDANALFRSKRVEEARERYTQLLDELERVRPHVITPEDPNPPAEWTTEWVAVLSNRAACWLQEGENQACIDDCTSILDVQADHRKALFRRATALERLKHWRPALEDLSQLLQHDPDNTLAQEAMRRVQQEHERAPDDRSAQALLDRLSCLQDDPPLPVEAAPVKEWMQQALTQFRTVPGLIHTFGSEGGFRQLLEWPVESSPALCPVAVLQFLDRCLHWEAAVLPLSQAVASDAGDTIWRDSSDGIPDEAVRVAFLADVAERLQMLLSRQQAEQRARHHTPAQSPAAIAPWLDSLLDRTTSVMYAVLQRSEGQRAESEADTRWEAVQACGRLWATRLAVEKAKETGLLRSVQRETTHWDTKIRETARRVLVRAVERTRPAETASGREVKEALQNLANTLCGPLKPPESTSATAGAEAATGGGGGEVEEVSSGMQRYRWCSHEEGEEVARAASTLPAFFLVDRTIALDILQQTGAMERLVQLAFSPEPAWQEIFAEVAGYLASDSEGRGLLESAQAFPALTALGDAQAATVRSSANLPLAKLLAGSNPTAQSGGSSAEEKTQSREAQADAMEALYHSLADDFQRCVAAKPWEGHSLSSSNTQLRHLSRLVESLATLVARAPVKVALAQDDATLRSLVDVLGALGKLADDARATTTSADAAAQAQVVAAQLPPEWSPLALGSCFIFYMLTLSEEARRARALASLQVTPEEWAQFERLTQGGLGGSSETTEADSPEAVDARIRSLLDQKFLAALQRLARAASELHMAVMHTSGRGPQGGTAASLRESASSSNSSISQWMPLSEAEEARRRSQEQRNMGPGAAALQAIASALQAMTERPWARARLVQGGALPLLLRLANERSGTTLEGRVVAAQGIAQLLMSTNPSLLPRNQVLDAVPPLLFLARGCDGLRAFEATVALTNIGSLDEATADRIIECRGLPTLEGVQFSDHVLLRRAGTEALVNLATTSQARQLILETRLPLWLALLRSYGEDRDTATAAAGGLAMALGDDPESVRALLRAKGALRSLASALVSGHQPLQHRALAIVDMILRHCEPAEWQALLVPMEIGEEEEEEEGKATGDRLIEDAEVKEDETAAVAGPPSGGSSVAPGTPTNRRSAEEALSAAQSAGPPSSGVQVAPAQLVFLLARGESFPDLSMDGNNRRDDEEEDDREDDREATAPLDPAVQAAAQRCVEALQSASSSL